MSGPFIPARAGQPIDVLEQGIAGGGWDALEEMFKPHLGGAPLQPDDDLARFMWGLYSTAQGKAMFEWMMDISLRQPLRVSSSSIEETALRAAMKQGINGFADAVLSAIAHGDKLVNKTKT